MPVVREDQEDYAEGAADRIRNGRLLLFDDRKERISRQSPDNRIDFASELWYTGFVTINPSSQLRKRGDPMPSGIGVTKQALEDFAKVQRRMLLAKEENAIKTYADLKKEYHTLKALLNVSGVNLTEIDEIKE